MKPACLLFAALSGTSALGAEPVEKAFGARDCRVMLEVTVPVEKVRWQGPCKDGYANGEGVLEWHDADGTQNGAAGRFEGGMKQGRRSGLAYVKDLDGDQFEGHFVDGKRDGKGILVTLAGSEYDGHWKGGKRHGYGSQVYATGGRYEGQWQDDKFHGHGKAAYIGGKVFEGEFVQGRRADSQLPAIDVDKQKYSMYEASNDPRAPVRTKRELSTLQGKPFDAAYEQLTPGQKQSTRETYPMLDEDDEPPFPTEGMQWAAAWMHKVQAKGSITGTLEVYVSVGSDGKATAVRTIRSPDPELTKAGTLVMMNEKFKPGRCAGKPCEMVYPIRYVFYLE